MKRYIRDFGNYGENLAINHIRNKNYKILHHKFFCKFGEIDIIASDKEFIVFIEVKTRSFASFGAPSEAINYIKRKRITKSSEYYLYKNNLLDNFIRFDVIEVIIDNDKLTEIIKHHENAFYI